MEKLVPLEYDSAPFDITRARLPVAYGGHDIQAIYTSVENRMPQAGGAGAAGFRPVVSQSWTVRPGSVYAFQVKPSDIDYDKREQTISAYCTLWAVLARGAPDMRNLGFRIAYAPTVDNRYVYTAPNGKKVEIEELKFREYTVAFENLSDFPVQKEPLAEAEQEKGKSLSSLDDALMVSSIVFGAPAGKKEAEQLQRNVRLLVLCAPVEPYVTSETVQVKPTAEKPGEYLAQHRYVHVRLLQLWVYDAYSGRILKKIGPSEEGRQINKP